MEGTAEHVIGDLVVNAKLSMGYERLRLYFTDKRILVSHLGKVGAGSVAPTFMFGSLGNAIGSLFGRNKGVREKKAQYPRPEKILEGHKSNFPITLDEIISVDLTRGPYNHSIAILSRDDKYDFTSTARFDHIQLLFNRTLRDKVEVHVKSETDDERHS